MPVRSFLLLVASAVFAFSADTWRPVRGGLLGGISDLALVEHTQDHSVFFIVHDNKALNEPRVALITIAGPKPITYQPLIWNFDKDCIDLESISTLPGHPNEFLALISRGIVYAVSHSGLMSALDIRSGQPKWEPLPIAGVNAPLPVGDVVYVVSKDGALTVINRESGQIYWTRDLNEGRVRQEGGFLGAATQPVTTMSPEGPSTRSG